MQFIIFDLEWNCAPIVKGSYLNEIIEIGAVKLDENLNEIGRFSAFVRPGLTDKLNKYVKNLTHITEADLKSASDFKTVFNEFERFSAGDDTVFMSWSNTDLHVLAENCRYYRGSEQADFIGKYADLQRYVMQYLPNDSNNQVSLSNAALQLGIPDDGLSLHRACDDSRLGADLLRKTYDEHRFFPFVRELDKKYYDRLMFKPYYVSDRSDPDFDISDFDRTCPECKKKLDKTGKIKFFRNVFTQKYICKICGKRYKLHVKIKKTYDSAIKNIKLSECVKKGENNERKKR